MGTNEPVKSPKEQATPGPYPEWAAALQVYYTQGAQPTGYYPQAASAPQHHPYMWGGQHMMPPYATPPYGAMYPPGAMYGHPTMPTPTGTPYMNYAMPSPSADTPLINPLLEEPKSNDMEKDMRRAKNNSIGNSTAVNNASNNNVNNNSNAQNVMDVKPLPSSGNGVFSQSGGDDDDDDDGSDDAVNDQNGVTMAIDGTRNPSANAMNQSMNIDYWNTQSNANMLKKRSNSASNLHQVGSMSGTQNSGAIQQSQNIPMASELWIQDEREIKRQRRKQSNRESARRSRLRKQAECEELGTRVEVLLRENIALRAELNRLHEECRKISSQNTSLQDQLSVFQGKGQNQGQIQNAGNKANGHEKKVADDSVKGAPSNTIHNNIEDEGKEKERSKDGEETITSETTPS